MEALIQYAIPVKGLRQGLHNFHFDIDDSFFSHFESSPIMKGSLELDLSFEKRTDMYLFEFSLKGSIKTECDRCLAPINLPVHSEEELLVKFTVENQEEEPDIVYVHPETQQFNVAPYVYEFIVLAVPMIKVYDCESEEQLPCNEDMLDYLEEAEDQTQEEAANNPFREALKGFNPGKKD